MKLEFCNIDEQLMRRVMATKGSMRLAQDREMLQNCFSSHTSRRTSSPPRDSQSLLPLLMVKMTEANDFSPCMSGLFKSAGNKTDGKQCIWDKTPSISLIHWIIKAVNIKKLLK
jgi:hypothetical protein